MLPYEYRWILEQFGPKTDPARLAAIARQLELDGNLEGAAAVYDYTFGLYPHAEEVRHGRMRILDQLAVTEHGIHFRYIPAGWFLMGSNHGEQDERPCHPVSLSAFWMSETPISWATYCQCMDWEAPPVGFPKQPPESTGFDRAGFHLREANKIRLQYCEDQTLHAGD